ncbi:MAG: tetratricopeptide repeat protein [Terracidiphilus sp.]
MRRGHLIALVFAGCLLAATRLTAQAPGGGQSTPAADGQKPAAAPPQSEANPFPTDTSNVPVLPTKREFIPNDDSYGGPENGSDARRFPLPGEDQDPVRSPDDAAPAADNGADQTWSSSISGIDRLLPRPEDDQTGKRKKKDTEIEAEHKETSSEDISVGKYYMDNKDWKGALSRFQSALVLDPEEPEIYWGLAECERHLGDFADARANYQKVIDYDPGSRHAKDATKALKEPEIANAKKPADAQAGK